MKRSNKLTDRFADRVANSGRGLTGRSGQTMILLALTVTAVLTVSGLILDGGMIYFEKRRMQAAVDAGAFGGSHELRRGRRDLESQVRPAVVNDTTLNGFSDSNSTIVVSLPPISGTAIGDTNFLEVSIERAVPTTFLRMLGVTASTVRARAVAGLKADVDACVIALDPDDSDALKVNGNPNLTVNCGVMVNSAAASYAFRTPGGGCVDATWIGVTGGFSANCASPPPMPEVPPIVDPLISLAAPTASGSGSKSTSGNVTTYTPGYYHHQIQITGDTHIFQPGEYVLRRGMKVTGGTVDGQGVSFYNINSSGNNFIDIGANATVTLAAPESGDMQGMLFYGNRDSPDRSPGNKLARGNETSYFKGVVYFPSQHIDFAGNPETAIHWTMVIANTIDISGTAAVQVINPPPGEGGPPVYSSLMLE